MSRVSPEFAKAARCSEEFNAEACLNCGLCTALCPMGYEVLPRLLFRQVILGLEDEVREQLPKVYSCLLCRMCQKNCPAEVQIADNVRFLRKYFNETEYKLK